MAGVVRVTLECVLCVALVFRVRFADGLVVFLRAGVFVAVGCVDFCVE